MRMRLRQPLNSEHTMQDGTDADGNPNLVDHSEKGKLMQLDAYSVNSVTMTPYYSPRNNEGENTKSGSST